MKKLVAEFKFMDGRNIASKVFEVEGDKYLAIHKYIDNVETGNARVEADILNLYLANNKETIEVTSYDENVIAN